MKAFLSEAWIRTKAFFYKTQFFWSRLGLCLLTIFLTMLLTFVLIKNIPGDVVYQYALKLQAERHLSYEAAYELATKLLNYDPNENFFVSFWNYIVGLFHGNLGQSIYRNDVTANSVIADYLPWTLLIASVSLLFSFVIGTKLGSVMSWRRKKASEVALTTYISVTSSIPDYLLGLILLIVFGYTLRWFPVNGAYDAEIPVGFSFAFIGSVLYHAALPILTYTITQIGGWALTARGSSVSVLGDDYVNAAVARGLPERVIIRRYLKRNAMLPLITSLVISFAYIFGGSTVMENIFAYPGIGYAFNSFIGVKDYFVVQGLFFFISTIVIVANFLSDAIYGFIDPRIRNSTTL